MGHRPSNMPPDRPPEPVAFAEAVVVWLRVALLSFGGPAGQVAVVHRILVDEKKWIDEPRFLYALNYCMLLPGPEAHQLAVYIGWLLHGVRGGLVAGGLFMLPGVIAIMLLSILYVLAADVGWIDAAFLGLKAAVLAIVLEAVIRLGRRALRDGLSRVVALAAFVAIFLFGVPFPVVVLGAGVTGFMAALASPPSSQASSGSLPCPPAVRTLTVLAAGLTLWLGPVLALLALLGPEHAFTRIGVFFSQMAAVSFGGAYAVLSYVAQRAVEDYGWLSPGEMLDGLGMAETTPGPLIMVVQFVAFMGAFRAGGALDPLVSGVIGGLIATWATFAPSFLWIFAGAPYMEVLRGNAAVAGALKAVTAAVVGVILNLALWFALRTLFGELRPLSLPGIALDVPVAGSLSWPALGLTLCALAAMFVLRLGMAWTLVLSLVLGLVLFLSGVASG